MSIVSIVKSLNFLCNTYIGFFFSEDEPTALVQNYGGPCSVISSVQVEYFGYKYPTSI